MSAIEIIGLQGQAILAHLDDLARLRLEVFREYPYLYAGSAEYERTYLRRYARSTNGLFVLALAGKRVVGVASGIPLAEEDAAFRRPFQEGGYDVDSVFYFGESVLEKAWRGKGIGHRFFDEREAHARRLGLATTCFCAVERPAGHPLRPAGYRPLDAFWQGRGYSRHPELHTGYAWQDLDDPRETEKRMVFWLRTQG